MGQLEGKASNIWFKAQLGTPIDPTIHPLDTMKGGGFQETGHSE